MRDPFPLRECDEAVGGTIGLDPDHGRAEALREPDVLLQRLGILRADAARLLARRLHVDGVPLRSEPAGNARAGPNHPRRERIRAHTHHHPLGNQRRLQPLAGAIARGLLPDLVRHRAQRQLAERREVALAKEVRERLLDLLRAVDLAGPQPAAQLLDGHVDVDDLVGAIEERVRHRLADAHAGRLGDRVVERLQVLDVHGGHDVDAGLEEVEHVLVALGVPAAGDVGVGELVDHTDLRLRARIASTSISSIVTPRYSTLRRGHDLEVLELRLGVAAAVGLDEADDHVDAAGPERVGLLEHLVGLADAGAAPM